MPCHRSGYLFFCAASRWCMEFRGITVPIDGVELYSRLRLFLVTNAASSHPNTPSLLALGYSILSMTTNTASLRKDPV